MFKKKTFNLEELPKDVLEYRISKLEYSQNMLVTFSKDRNLFIERYLRNIFWEDDNQGDRDYRDEMSYGLDFHLVCERLFLDIPFSKVKKCFRDDLVKIREIKEKYKEAYGDRVEFFPEARILLKNGVVANIDLLVLVYEKSEEGNISKEGNISEDSEGKIDNRKLEKIFIWDWKTEKRTLTEANLLNKMQTKVYLYAIKESLGKDLEFGDIYMYYFQPRLNNRVRLRYSEELHLNYSREILSTIESIKALAK